MSKYTKPESIAKALERKPIAQEPPKQECMRENCQGDRYEKRYLSGTTGAFEWKTRRATKDLVALPGNRLICQECYSKHIEAMKLGRLSPVLGEQPERWVQEFRDYDATKDREIAEKLHPRKHPAQTTIGQHIAQIRNDLDRYADSIHDKDENHDVR